MTKFQLLGLAAGQRVYANTLRSIGLLASAKEADELAEAYKKQADVICG